jgi:thiamine-phosphate pyrophosphorylase
LAGRRLYLCTADRPDLTEFLSACMRGGVDIVQLRDKTLDARPLIKRAREAKSVCADFDVPFILNDRPDLALECGADGVHVGQDDAPTGLARRILGPGAIIGLSTHAAADWAAAEGEPVDYLSAGPVNATPTKPGRPGTGLGYIEHVAGSGLGQRMPWYVTGGATPETIPDMLKAGASRFVVVRYLTESGDPETAARRLVAAVGQIPG